jgi:CHAT domain-containing protein
LAETHNMKYIILFVLLFVGIGVSQTRNNQLDIDLKKGLTFFNLENPNFETDKKALFYFEKLTKHSPKTKAEAIIIAEANIKAGILIQAENHNHASSKYYKKSISLAKKFKLADSVVYQPMLYLSGLHYYKSEYDSCLTYLSEAEKLYDKNPKLSEAERLFNTKGVLLFESGNFRQSLVYFKKAETLAGNDDFTNQNNQALVLQFLKQPDSTFKILRKLEKKYPTETSIKINIASVLIELNKPNEAIKYLKNIKQQHDNRIYLNTFGKAFLKINNLTTAKAYFEKAKALKTNQNKNSDLGFTEYYLGQIAFKQNDENVALTKFQNALINVDYFFNELDVFKNPLQSSSDFHSVFLLDILFEKALCFKKLYEKTNNKDYLKGAILTFEAMKKMAHTISKTYNHENARLDIVADIHPKYQRYTDFLWTVYKKTNDIKYAHRAFEIAEEGKAIVLALSINESNLKQNTHLPDSLLTLESNQKITLAALIRNLEGKNGIDQKVILKNINETEIKINKLNAKLETFAQYKELKYKDNEDIKIEKLRENIGDDDIVISFVNFSDKALVFGLTKKYFKCYEINKEKTTLDLMVKSLKFEIINNQKSEKTAFVYEKVLQPFYQLLKDHSNIIFIPDGQFNGLPIEILKEENNKYLIEKHAVNYLYSAKFILNQTIAKKTNGVLAFAPFTAIKYCDEKDFLPNSFTEVTNIAAAKTFINHQANKKAFTDNYKNYDIIHLATHAVADLKNPEKSYIRFSNKNTEDDKLYLFEFTPGVLKNTSLVVLSACDSFGNTLLEGEGTRGLSRGFYLAGSQNIISSLWQADDFTTAYILKKFYEHLNKGNSYQKALQGAKKDLLNDPKMAQFQNPKYWSHLILVGYQKPIDNYLTATAFWFGLLILTVLLLYIFKTKSIFKA